MSSKYQGERAMREASRALLRVLETMGTATAKKLYQELNPGTPVIPQLFRNRLSYLKRAGYINISSKHSYSITDKGLQRLEEIKFQQIKQFKKWDKTWRIIAFDIPETNRGARDAVRRLIKQLGCYQLQRSVWIHPLPCLEQFKQIQSAYGIKAHLQLMEVSWIDNEKYRLKTKIGLVLKLKNTVRTAV